MRLPVVKENGIKVSLVTHQFAPARVFFVQFELEQDEISLGGQVAIVNQMHQFLCGLPKFPGGEESISADDLLRFKFRLRFNVFEKAIPTRTKNALRKAGFTTIGQLVAACPNERHLRERYDGVGLAGAKAMTQLLKDLQLRYGMRSEFDRLFPSAPPQTAAQ